MLQPKRTKFRKTQKGRNRGLAERGSKVSFGEYSASDGTVRKKAPREAPFSCTVAAAYEALARLRST